MRNVIHALGRAYINRILQSAKDAHKPRRINERPVELAFVFRWLNALQPGLVLDVGTGTSPLPALIANSGIRVDAIDNIKDYWTNGMFNRHWVVQDENIVSPRSHRTYDVITCLSVLEHIAHCDKAMDHMISMLRPGGHLLLTCPYSERHGHSNVYTIPGSYGAHHAFGTRQFCRADLDRWLQATSAKIVEQEYWRAFDSDYWSVGSLIRPIERATVSDPHQLTCVAIRRNET